MTRFFYVYILRGIGWVLLGAMLSIIASFFVSCGGSRPAQEPPKAEVAAALKAQKEGASEQMRNFKLETAPPPKQPKIVQAAKMKRK